VSSVSHSGPNWTPLKKSASASTSTVGNRGLRDQTDSFPWPGIGEPKSPDQAKRHEILLRGRWVQAAYALIDACCIFGNSVLCFELRFPAAHVLDFFRPGPYPAIAPHYGGFLVLNICLTLLFCQEQRLYRTPRERSALDESLAVVKAVSFAGILMTAFLYLSGINVVSRLVVVTTYALNALTLSLWRYAKRRMVLRRAERGIGARNALVIGAGGVGQALATELENNKLLGYRFVGFLDSDRSADARTLGRVEDLRRVVRTEYVDEIFVTVPSERELVKGLVREAQAQRLSINVIPELYDGVGWAAPFRRLGNFPVMDLHWQPLPTFGLFLKRIIDVVVSSIMLIVCIPIFAVVALLIKLDSSGTAFYIAPRAGKKGRPFRCVKFRTMVVDADKLKEKLRGQNERAGPCFKIANDPRMTPLGRILRKYSADELPQLWNVLVGDMSLVGPRPHPLDDYKQYDLDHRRRLEVKPGITGLWQVTARQDPSFETNMRLDLQYIEQWSLKLDFEIMIRTAGAIVRAEGR
jgi:exopolysaccharide biosynthesis polyprenyl glycosylphosphotransferase